MSEDKNIEERQEAQGEGLKEEIPGPSTPANEMVPENTASLAPSTINPVRTAHQPGGPQPSNMEVHHHGHVHHQKKWKEYLFQFLMLFLAVFCGFLAEYRLEHTIEQNREKQFIASLIKDLELDTLELSAIHKYRVNKLHLIDSIISFFAGNTLQKVPATAYRSSMQLYGHYAFYQNSGTLDQLKNSGGLRLIHKRNIVDSIEAYHQQVRRMIKRDEFETDEMRNNTKLAEKLFDGNDLAKLSISSASPGMSNLVSLNREYLPEYLNNLTSCRFLVKVNLQLFQSNKKKAANLITLIKKEYHLR